MQEDQLTPGDLAVGIGYGGSLHAARLEPTEEHQRRRYRPLCGDYRTRDGNRLASHRKSRGAPSIHGLVYANKEDGTSDTSDIVTWADAMVQAAGAKSWRGRSICRYCVAVWTHGGDGQPGHGGNPLEGLDPATVAALANGDTVELANPLTSQQARAIKQLIDNSFASVRTDLDLQHAQYVNAETARINSQYTDLDEKRERVNELARAFRERVTSEWTEVLREIRETYGLEPDTRHHYSLFNAPSVWSSKSREAALKELKTASDAAHREAVHLISSQRLAAERKLLLAQVPAGVAQAFLGQVPSVAEVLAQGRAQADAKARLTTGTPA